MWTLFQLFIKLILLDYNSYMYDITIDDIICHSKLLIILNIIYHLQRGNAIHIMIKVVGVLCINKKQVIASWFFVARSTITTRFKHRSSFLLSILRKHILKWGLPKKVIHSSSWTREVCDPKDTWQKAYILLE